MTGEIVDIYSDTQTCVYVKHGVKKKDQYKYERCPGGFGTYVTGGTYESYVYVKVRVDERKTVFEEDIREQILALNNRSKISERLVAQIKQKNIGKRIELESCNGELKINLEQLDLIV